MKDQIGVPSRNIGTGSSLLLKDIVGLASGAIRKSEMLNTQMSGRIGIDISADQNCTVKLVRLPDGETEGASSELGTVTAGTPAFFVYTSLLCPGVKVVVENTGGADMTAFAMYVRGAA